MGARPEEYARAAPYMSYIHVDEFRGPRQLAEYLLELDRDDAKYNQYFQWKGTGEFINTRFFCRVCALMHNTQVCTHRYDLGQLVLILIISVSWFSSSLSRSVVGSHHYYLGHHLNDFKS